jgi:hypothetical protein
MHAERPQNAHLTVNNKPIFKRVGQCLYRNTASGIYYALVKKRGKQHRKSLRTTDRLFAGRKLIEFRRQVNGFIMPTKDRNITFMELANDWFGAAKTRYKASAGVDLVELLAYSGMRLSEATGMVWTEIDFERGQFTVTGGAKGTKNHEARTVPLFPALRKLLERIKQQEQIEPTQRVIQINSAKKVICHACKKAGLPHFHHHLFRHFFVSQAIENNVDFRTISAWVGHKDGGVLVAKTYGHLSDVHSADMAKKMTFYVH